MRGTLVGGASLLVPLFVTACARRRGAPGPHAAEYSITDWIAILPSGEVVLGVSQPEVGQGSYTALPQILADELDADWSRVSVRFVTDKEAYTISFHASTPARASPSSGSRARWMPEWSSTRISSERRSKAASASR